VSPDECQALETIYVTAKHTKNTRVNMIMTTNHLIQQTKNHNMAEPQPSQIQEGDQAPSAIPGSNKSENAVLNSLDKQATELKSTNTASTAALGKAMKNLNLSSDGKSEVKNVKVEMADAILLVSTRDRFSETVMGIC
jgi:hypothetical protein